MRNVFQHVLLLLLAQQIAAPPPRCSPASQSLSETVLILFGASRYQITLGLMGAIPSMFGAIARPLEYLYYVSM